MSACSRWITCSSYLRCKHLRQGTITKKLCLRQFALRIDLSCKCCAYFKESDGVEWSGISGVSHSMPINRIEILERTYYCHPPTIPYIELRWARNYYTRGNCCVFLKLMAVMRMRCSLERLPHTLLRWGEPETKQWNGAEHPERTHPRHDDDGLRRFVFVCVCGYIMHHMAP